jgi:uncharacterized membrane protein
MSGADLGLAVSVFLACAVEAVEALTIVLAVGTTRSWSSALAGAGAAGLALAVIVAALGPALVALPIDVLRVVIGGLLLTFGLQWLRKAILRSAGLRAKHDELDAYEHEVAAARAAGTAPPGFDGYSFTIAFKGVLLEGLEVAFIVLTLGANQHRIGLAAAAAALAIVAVLAAGVLARAPLARVPENTMKLAVGVMLSSFGIFWGAEGAGASWPAGDAALLAIVPAVLVAALALASLARTRTPRMLRTGRALRMGRALRTGRAAARSGAPPPARHAAPAAIAAVWGFVVGDDWRTAAGVVTALLLTALLAAASLRAWWVMPVGALLLLSLSIRRAARDAAGLAA